MIAVSLETRMLADHRRKLEAVELRHADVDQDDRDFVLEQKLQGLARRRRLDQVLAQLAQNHLIAEQLGRLIVDQQDVDFIAVMCAPPSDAATSAARTAAVRC